MESRIPPAVPARRAPPVLRPAWPVQQKAVKNAAPKNDAATHKRKRTTQTPARKPLPRRRSERCNGNKESLVSRPDFESLSDSKSPRSSAAATESRLSLARKPPPRRRSERCNGNKASLVSRPDFESLPDAKSPRSSAAATESRLSLGSSAAATESRLSLAGAEGGEVGGEELRLYVLLESR